MAELIKEQRILEIVVDNKKAVERMAELTKAIRERKQREKELQKQVQEGTLTEDEYYEEVVKNKQAQQTLSKELRELGKEMQNSINMDRQREGSLAQLRSELSNLTAQYDTMSRAERNSAEGEALAEKIRGVSNQIKNSEEGTNRWYRNVGNYTNGVMDALGKVGSGFSGLIGPIKNATGALGVMAANPVIAMLGLMATLLMKVVEALGSSEETTNRMSSALSIFGVAGTAVTKMLQELGRGVAWVSEKLAGWADKLGLVTEEMKEHQRIAQEQIEIDKQARENLVANAKDEERVSDLRAKVAQKDRYTAEERKAMLQEAIDIETERARREEEAAQREYDLAKRRAELSDNSKEDNDKLAEAEVKLIQSRTSLSNKTRELNGQMSELNNSLKKEQEEVAKAAEASRKAAEEMQNAALAAAEGAMEDIFSDIIEQNETLENAGIEEVNAETARQQELFEIKKKEVAARLGLIKEENDETLNLKREQRRLQFEEDMAALGDSEEYAELRKLTTEQFFADMGQMTADYNASQEEAAQRTADAQVAIEEAKQMALAGVMGTLSDLMVQFSDKNKALLVASKALALGEIAINSGVAIAKGIKQSQSVPFPANLASIAATTGAILAAVTSAISTVKSAKFARGGTVVGEGSGTSDSISARLSNGESVMTAQSTSMFAPFLSAMNVAAGGRPIYSPSPDYGKGMGLISQAVADGMRSVDIRVGVDEISRVSQQAERAKKVGVI